MTKKISLLSPATIQELDSLAPVYRRYQGQQKPQPAHITISPEAEQYPVSVGYSGEVGGGTRDMMEYQGRELLLPIAPDSKGKSILEFIERYQAHFEKIVAGYELVCWSTAKRGRLSDEAYNTFLWLCRMADPYSGEISLVDVYDDISLLDLESEITLETDAEQLATEVLADLHSEGAAAAFDYGDLVEYITDYQAHHLEDDE